MRPNEIDYTKRLNHYFDTTNGEVLVGERDYRRYLAEGASADTIKNLGALLRDPGEVVQGAYEALDIAEWDQYRYIQYGRWIRKIIAPPANGARWITHQTLINAQNLGVGPTKRQIFQEFGKPADYFAALKLARSDVSVRGALAHWCLDDYIRYLQKISQGNPPSQQQIASLAAKDAAKPSVRQMEQKYPHIKFRGLLKLAGYTGGLPVIRSWDKDEYIAWGVRFMQANHGAIPTALSADYFSTRKLGPSSGAISNNFVSVPLFEREVSIAYWESRAEQEQDMHAKLAALREALENETVPGELLGDGIAQAQAINIVQQQIKDISDEHKTQQIKSVISRYAKYVVLEFLTPNMGDEKKLEIAASDILDSDFVRSIRQHYNISGNEIEHAALMKEFFNDIWPLNAQLPSLKLGKDYDQYCKERTDRQLALRKAKRQKRRIQKSPV